MAKLFTPLRCIDAAIALQWQRARSSGVHLAGIGFAKSAEYRGDADAIRLALHWCLDFALRDSSSKGVLLAVKDHAGNNENSLKFSMTVFREATTMTPVPLPIPKSLLKLDVQVSNVNDQSRYSFTVNARRQEKKPGISASSTLGNILLVSNDRMFAHLFKRRVRSIDNRGTHRACRSDEQALQILELKHDLIFIDHGSVNMAEFKSSHRRTLEQHGKLVSVGKGDEASLTMCLDAQMLSHHWEDLLNQIAQRPESGLNVLLAEDSPVNRRVMQLRLQKLGHRVEAVANGQLALDAAIARPFDLILMDIQMPVMSGTTAIAQIRASRGPCAATPIVALTGLTEPEEIKGILNAGADSILTKPIGGPALDGVLANGRARPSTTPFAAEEIT